MWNIRNFRHMNLVLRTVIRIIGKGTSSALKSRPEKDVAFCSKAPDKYTLVRVITLLTGSKRKGSVKVRGEMTKKTNPALVTVTVVVCYIWTDLAPMKICPAILVRLKSHQDSSI
jgi:small nuclear ribonucleoprotein (snRNP)-like protein